MVIFFFDLFLKYAVDYYEKKVRISVAATSHFIRYSQIRRGDDSEANGHAMTRADMNAEVSRQYSE